MGFVALAVTSFSFVPTAVVNAAPNVPYNTWTLGPGGAWLPTQTAYVPGGRFAPELTGGTPLNRPDDFFIDEDAGYIYIADTGNSRIVVMDMEGNFVAYFGREDNLLGQPMGITVRDGYIYVADRQRNYIFIFDQDTLELTSQIGRPDSPLIGDSPFSPTKIEVDERGGIYIISEGNAGGIMQLTADGEFLGFIGANRTAASLQNIFVNFFFGENQTVFRRAPRSPTNLAMDSRGLLYTVTHGTTGGESIKMLNTRGSVIAQTGFYYAVDVFIDEDNIMYVVHSNGWIDVIDSNFQYVYFMGGGPGGDRLGSLSSPRAISVTRDKRMFALDGTDNAIVVFEPTSYALLLVDAMNMYRDGRFLEGEPLWQEIIDLNPNFILSYRALARASMLRGEYSQALRQFGLAEYREG